MPIPAREIGPAQQQLQDLSTVEDETCGSFPNGFGDNAPEEGSGDDQYHDDALLNIRPLAQGTGVFDFALPSDCFIDAMSHLTHTRQISQTCSTTTPRCTIKELRWPEIVSGLVGGELPRAHDYKRVNCGPRPHKLGES